MNDHKETLRAYMAEHPYCARGKHRVIDCLRIIEDMEENPAISPSKFNFQRCRFDKSGRGCACPPGAIK